MPALKTFLYIHIRLSSHAVTGNHSCQWQTHAVRFGPFKRTLFFILTFTLVFFQLWIHFVTPIFNEVTFCVFNKVCASVFAHAYTPPPPTLPTSACFSSTQSPRWSGGGTIYGWPVTVSQIMDVQLLVCLSLRVCMRYCVCVCVRELTPTWGRHPYLSAVKKKKQQKTGGQ